ncbi:MAG: hypothetical protein CMQ20_05195 [Gammaproteobacteria bacterium]|jgi:hypothetical protein|nr:hypothetical protein [Gammaproteobacteria bacterium]|tara:strand:- start:2143 stop:2397 length:255 start_codon:yes stop_codon:yes gene_type:complete
MNRTSRRFGITSLCFILSSCGGNDETDAAPAPVALPTEAVETPAAKKTNNPLASQQQLIRDAKGIQGILDKDAEEKKKALEKAN